MTRILVLEDERRFRHYLVRALRLEGHEVMEVATGGEATARVRDFDPELLIVDWMLGGGEDGVAVAARLARSRPGLRTILMTGHPADELQSTLRSGAVHAVISKPFAPVALFEAVERLVETDSPS